MSAKKHIVHIRDSSDIYGGERVILTLGKFIAFSESFDMSLVCMRRGDGRSEALITAAGKVGINVKPVDVKGRLDFKAISRIREYIQLQDVSLIHTHDFKSDLYGFWATRELGVRRVATAHGSTRDSLTKKAYLFLDERVVYRGFDTIIAVSQQLENDLQKKHVPTEKIRVIQNGLDIELLDLQAGASEPSLPLEKRIGARVFGVIGRLFPDKGQNQFLEAFAAIADRHPDSYGLIVGDGPDRARLSQRIDALGLQGRVYLCGARKNIKSVYELIDFLVIPSLTEGLPYVLLEAMATGIPVVATAVGDIPLLIEDEVRGYLISPGDVAALTKRMTDLLTKSDLASAMAQQGKALIAARYSAQRMVDETERVYSELLG